MCPGCLLAARWQYCHVQPLITPLLLANEPHKWRRVDDTDSWLWVTSELRASLQKADWFKAEGMRGHTGINTQTQETGWFRIWLFLISLSVEIDRWEKCDSGLYGAWLLCLIVFAETWEDAEQIFKAFKAFISCLTCLFLVQQKMHTIIAEGWATGTLYSLLLSSASRATKG